jgi:hypothetical protein
VTRLDCDARRRILTAWAVAVACLLIPPPARAQAWVAPAGTGSVTLFYQFIDNTGHRVDDGSLLREGESTDASFYVETSYAFTDRFSFSLGVPYVFAKYTGTIPPARLPVDTCRCWHSGFADWGATARYNLLSGAFALTPSVSVVIPTHNYNHKGEAVIGGHLKELRLAVEAGQRLDAISRNLYVLGQYSYAVVERAAGVSHNRSNLAFEGDYVVKQRLVLRGLAAVQRTHGGLRAIDINTPLRLDEHDRLIRDNNWRVGGGAVYSFHQTDVFATIIEFVQGTDTHAGRLLTVGVSWHFEPFLQHNRRSP